MSSADRPPEGDPDDPSLATIQTGTQGDAFLIAVAGNLQHANLANLQGALARARNAAPAAVALDLSKTEFVSSVSWGTLLAFSNEMKRAGRTFEIVAMSRSVSYAFRLLGLPGSIEERPEGSGP